MEFLKPSKLLVKLEVFDHGIFPLPPKLQQQNIIPLFKDLGQFSNTNYIIKLDQFKTKVEQNSINLTSSDAEILFLFYKLFSESDWSFLNLFTSPNKTNEKSNLGCDVRGLSIFFFLQLFSSSSTRHYLEKKPKEFSATFSGNFGGMVSLNNQFNEGLLNKNTNAGSPLLAVNNMSFSPLNSPRTKTVRVFNYSTENQNIFSYLKFNMKIMLKLLTNESISNETDTYITLQDIEPLSIFLSSEQKNNKQSPLSFAFSMIFKNMAHKLYVNSVSEWIGSNMIIPESNENTIVIQGLTKSVTLRDAETCLGKSLRISSCEDSYIYIDGCLENVYIMNCVNCTIFIACARKFCTVDKSENISLSVVSNVLRIGNTIDSKIYFYGPMSPILFGDNRSIILGPNNVNYMEFMETLKKSGMPISTKHTNNFKSPLIMNKDNNINLHIMSSKDFFPCILPNNYKNLPFLYVKDLETMVLMKATDMKDSGEKKQLEEGNLIVPILAPIEYKEEVVNRYKKINEMQNIIKNVGLNEDQGKNLHSLLQGYYKEWLMNTNAIKPITDLIKLIDQE